MIGCEISRDVSRPVERLAIGFVYRYRPSRLLRLIAASLSLPLGDQMAEAVWRALDHAMNANSNLDTIVIDSR
jgi:hypothetical protein